MITHASLLLPQDLQQPAQCCSCSAKPCFALVWQRNCTWLSKESAQLLTVCSCVAGHGEGTTSQQGNAAGQARGTKGSGPAAVNIKTGQASLCYVPGQSGNDSCCAHSWAACDTQHQCHVALAPSSRSDPDLVHRQRCEVMVLCILDFPGCDRNLSLHNHTQPGVMWAPVV